MYIVYVLKSEKDGNMYIGCTSDIEKRIKMHNAGRVQSTKHRVPFGIIYTENYAERYEAFKRECYYKTAKGKKELKKKIKG